MDCLRPQQETRLRRPLSPTLTVRNSRDCKTSIQVRRFEEMKWIFVARSPSNLCVIQSCSHCSLLRKPTAYSGPAWLRKTSHARYSVAHSRGKWARKSFSNLDYLLRSCWPAKLSEIDLPLAVRFRLRRSSFSVFSYVRRNRTGWQLLKSGPNYLVLSRNSKRSNLKRNA